MKNIRSCASWLPASCLAAALCVSLGSMFLAGAGPDKIYTPPDREFTLKVSMSKGVAGYPAMGTEKRKAGTIVKYSYSPASGFDGLVVKLDGAVVAASGAFVMSADRTLDTYAYPYYTLKVMNTGYNVGPDEPYTCRVLGACLHEGVPACGVHKIRRGETVQFHLHYGDCEKASLFLAAYPPPPGVCPPVLRSFGEKECVEWFTGSFVMDRDYTLVLNIDLE